MRRTIKNKRQLARFGLVGGINTALDFGLLFLLKSFGLPVVSSNIISTSAAFLFSFVANKKYTFKSTGTSVVREMILFTLITLIGLWMLQTLVITLLTPLLVTLLHNESGGLFAAKMAATIVSLTWNYILYAHVVFKKKAD